MLRWLVGATPRPTHPTPVDVVTDAAERAAQSLNIWRASYRDARRLGGRADVTAFGHPAGARGMRVVRGISAIELRSPALHLSPWYLFRKRKSGGVERLAVRGGQPQRTIRR